MRRVVLCNPLSKILITNKTPLSSSLFYSYSTEAAAQKNAAETKKSPLKMLDQFVQQLKRENKPKKVTVPDRKVALKKQQEVFAKQMTRLRKEYEEASTKMTKERDERSVQKFMQFRSKVLEYRKRKNEIALQHVKKNEEYMHLLGSEYGRVKKEKEADRLNHESIAAAYRIDGIRRLKEESDTYITPENIDEHIANQLSFSKLLVPTIFYNRFGVNDEVAYEVYQESLKEMEYERLTALGDNDSLRKVREMEDDSKLLSDPLYPGAKFLVDMNKQIFPDISVAPDEEEPISNPLFNPTQSAQPTFLQRKKEVDRMKAEQALDNNADFDFAEEEDETSEEQPDFEEEVPDRRRKKQVRNKPSAGSDQKQPLSQEQKDMLEQSMLQTIMKIFPDKK